jgi:putative ABC transport system permease protein
MSEKSQIAMLRSIGFSTGKIRSWQMYRISIVLIIGVVIGIILSTFLNDIALKPIFSMMGATHIKIVPNPLEVYLLYPIILLAVISIAAYIASGIVKKFDLMEINNAD